MHLDYCDISISDADMPDGSSTAVMEAKRWLETKKLVSNSKSELEFGTCSLNSAILPHVSTVYLRFDEVIAILEWL